MCRREPGPAGRGGDRARAQLPLPVYVHLQRLREQGVHVLLQAQLRAGRRPTHVLRSVSQMVAKFLVPVLLICHSDNRKPAAGLV